MISGRDPGTPSKTEVAYEYGVIATLRKKFGFIRSCSRSLDLFFHFSDLHAELSPQQLVVGLEVQFQPMQDPNTKRIIAKSLSRAPKGCVVFEVVSEQQLLGQVMELPSCLLHPASADTSPPAVAGPSLLEGGGPNIVHGSQQNHAGGASKAGPSLGRNPPAEPSAGISILHPTSEQTSSGLQQSPATAAGTAAGAPHGMPGPPGKPASSLPASPGLIRYLPEPGKVLHITFQAADVQQGCPPMQVESLVLFNVCTNTRAANAARESNPRAHHHASNRAVKVMVLDPATSQYLEPGLRKDMAILRLLGAAFPIGSGVEKLL